MAIYPFADKYSVSFIKNENTDLTEIVVCSFYRDEPIDPFNNPGGFYNYNMTLADVAAAALTPQELVQLKTILEKIWTHEKNELGA